MGRAISAACTTQGTGAFTFYERGFFASIGALLAGKLQRRSGFVVETLAAIAVLAKSSPEAAAWWQENTPHLLRKTRYFVFPQDVGHVSETGPGA